MGKASDLALGAIGGAAALLVHALLEVRDPDLVKPPHLRHRSVDPDRGHLAAGRVDLFHGHAQETLHAADIAINVIVEELDDEPVEREVYEAGLGEQVLGRSLVVRLRVLGEMLASLHAVPTFCAIPRVDGDALEMEVDLDLVFRELDAQVFAAVDVWSRVVRALDRDVAVGVELRPFPLGAVGGALRDWTERRLLMALESLAPRDAEPRVGLAVDLLHAVEERTVDLIERGKRAAAVAPAEETHDDLHRALDDGLVFGPPRPRRHDGGAVRGRQLRVGGIQIGIVDMALQHALLEAVGCGHRRHSAKGLVHPAVRGEPVAALHILTGPGEEELAVAEGANKNDGAPNLAGLEIDPFDLISGVVNFGPLPRGKLAESHRGLPVLGELAVELFPEVRVGREAVGPLIGDKLHGMAVAEVPDHGGPINARHPKRIGDRLRRGRRWQRAVSHASHRIARAFQRPGDLAHAPAGRKQPLHLFIPHHRQRPSCHPRSFRV